MHVLLLWGEANKAMAVPRSPSWDANVLCLCGLCDKLLRQELISSMHCLANCWHETYLLISEGHLCLTSK